MENLNKKFWLSENAKSILIVIWFIVLWIILRMLGLIFKWWPLYFIINWLDGNGTYKTNENNVTNNVPFEKKEKCMQYYDKYKQRLEELWNYDTPWLKMRLADYEFFYSKLVDSCVWVYRLTWIYNNDIDASWFGISDYLNWEKELYSCTSNPIINDIEWIDCFNEWNVEKTKYKN